MTSLKKGPGHPPAAPALPSACSVRGTWPSSRGTTVTEIGHSLGHRSRTNKHEEGIGPTPWTNPQLPPTCGSPGSEAEEAGCLMANALACTQVQQEQD